MDLLISFFSPTAVKKPPFRLDEEGWGEFEMQIVLTAAGKGGDHTLDHDLNFQSERYEAKHWITFKNPKPELIQLLKESGPVPGEENGARSRSSLPNSKKKKDKAVGLRALIKAVIARLIWKISNRG